MSTQTASAYCWDCDERRAVVRPRVNHLLHAFLTVVTGVWLFVWILATLFRSPWRCSHCGSGKVGPAE